MRSAYSVTQTLLLILRQGKACLLLVSSCQQPLRVEEPVWEREQRAVAAVVAAQHACRHMEGSGIHHQLV